MPEETIWTLGADGEDVMAVLDEIDSSIQAMSDGIDAAVSGMDESFGALSASIDEIAQMSADGAAAFNGLDDALSATTDAATSTSDALTNLSSANDAMAQTLSEDNQIISGLNEQITNLSAQLEMLTIAEEDAGTGANTLADDLAKPKDEAPGLMEAVQGAMGPIMMLGTVAVMAGAKFISMGMDGQKGEALLRGMAGASTQDIQMLQQAAMQLGLSMTDATAGFYQVESAGYSGAAAITVFTAATKLSEGGQASAADTMSALTAIMHDYSAKASDSTHYTDLMATAVVRGKQSMQDFATSIGPLASAGENVGLSFQQVAAAEATMTQINPSVMRDSMQLTGLFQSLDPAIGGVAGKAKKLKLSFDEAHYSSLDLLGKLQYLAEISGGTDTAAFVKLTGGVRGSTAAIDLLKGGAASFKGNLQAMGHATGATATAFASFENTVPAHLNKVGAALSVFATRFMDAVGPHLIPIIDGLTNAISFMADFISQHMDIVLPILAALAAVIGVVLVLAIGAFLAPLVTLIAAFWPFILAIAAAAAIAVVLAQHWTQIIDALHLTGPIQRVTDLFHTLGNVVGTAFGYMHRQAAEQTLQMKIQTINHTEAMAKGNVANITRQEQAIEAEMRKTTNASELHMLRMKLQALQQSKAQADGVIKNMQHEREGVQQQLALMDPVVHLHDLARKDSAISATIEGTQRTIAGYSQMRAGIETQMTRTTDVVKRHALEMQLASINAAQKQKEGVLKQLEGQRQGTEKQMSQLHSQIDSENNNILLRTGHAFQQLGSAIATGWGNLMGVVMPVLQAIGSFLAGAFMASMQAVGTFLSTTFAPVWQQLVITWQTQFVPLMGQLGQAFSSLGPPLMEAWQALQPVLQVVGMFFAIVGGGVLATLVGVFLGFLEGLVKAIANFLSGLITMASGMIQIFVGIFQVIAGIVSFIIDLVTGHFSRLGGDLHGIMLGISNIIGGMWKFIQGIFQTVFGTIMGFVTGFIGGIIGWFQHLFDMLVGHSIVPDMMAAIVGFFAGLPGRVLSVLAGFIASVIVKFTGMATQVQSGISGLVSFIASTLGSLGSKAVGWAADMMSGFINGIKGGMSGLGNAIGGVGNFISSHLHFSKPEEGALATADTRMPDMMQMLATGITANVSKIKQAVSGVTGEISHGLTPSGAGIGASGGLGGTAHTALLQQILQTLQQQGRGQTAGYAPVPPSFSQNNSFTIGGGMSSANMQELYLILNQWPDSKTNMPHAAPYEEGG